MKIALTFFSIFISLSIFSQKEHHKNKPNFIRKSNFVQSVPALAGRNLIPVDLTPTKNNNNRWLNYPTNFEALPKGKDPLLAQNNNYQARVPGNPVIQNFEGASEATNAGAGVPDSTGAVGPNHYIHAYNVGFVIFDKQGNILVPHASLANLFPNHTDGDPIVFYDRYADRFVITQFEVGGFAQGPYSMLVAICQGSDPVNDGWNTYEFPMDDMPDYPKFAVWRDGYYLTANKSSGNTVYVINRDQMIAGQAQADIVGFQLPGVDLNPNAVFAPMAMNSIGPNLPPVNTPGHVVYLQDDAWATGPDHLKIWDVTVDWNSIANSSISNPVQINTTPFDSFTAAFGLGEVPQPGTTQKIDGITGVLSFACNYYQFADHNSVTVNFNVDVNGDNTRLGIRWFELRNNNGWNIQQEGTFAPNDTFYRFMGSMGIDAQGNIGLAYSKADANTPTSLYFTGRHANDPFGQMTIDEEVIIDGLGVNAIHNRFGDYSQLTLDPTDNKTFWFVGEYFDANNAWKTRIASFKIAPNTTNDVGITAITNPTSGTLSNSEQVTVTIFNFGENAQSNIPISFSVDGAIVANEVYNGTVNSGATASYTFTTTANLGTLGQTYEISATTNLMNDEDTTNDNFTKNVTFLQPNDIGVTAINAPSSGIALSANEQVTVTITNFGGEEQSNFNVSYTINGNQVTEQVTGPLQVGGTLDYTFNQTADFSALGDYNVAATTSLSTDSDTSNDAISSVITNSNCQPSINCNDGDGLRLFQLESINNTSSCEGYGDFTDLSTDLIVGSTNNLTLTTSYGDQHVNVWIDFNDNFVFEANELVVNDYVIAAGSADGTFTETTSLVIPQNATFGSHLLRAKTNWDGIVPTDACEVTDYGETEDYTVNITYVSSVDTNVFNQLEMTVSSLGNNQFLVNLPSLEIEDTLIITLHNMLGQKFVKNRVKNSNGLYTYQLNLNGLSAGVYLVRLGTTDFGKVKRIIVR